MPDCSNCIKYSGSHLNCLIGILTRFGFSHRLTTTTNNKLVACRGPYKTLTDSCQALARVLSQKCIKYAVQYIFKTLSFDRSEVNHHKWYYRRYLANQKLHDPPSHSSPHHSIVHQPAFRYPKELAFG